MKTLIVTLSPRKSFSTSMYFSKVLKFFSTKGQVSILEVKTQKQFLELEHLLPEVDNLVFATPVYVDTIPSTVLERLKQIENFVKNRDISLNVYSLTNCGFYEGEQCQLAINTFKLWCDKCGFTFKGGLGVGAGVMVGFIRTLIPIGVAITLLEILIRAIACLMGSDFSAAAIFNHFFPYTLVIQTGLYLLWSMGLFVNAFKMAKYINSGADMNVKYTGLWFCPRFLFVIMASIYWVLASMIWYRGAFWRLHKEPKN